MRIPINQDTRPEREAEIADQDAIHFGTGLETPAHPISEVRGNPSGTDSTGSYTRGKEMSGDPDVPAQNVTRDDMRGQSETGPVGTEVAGVSGGAVTGGERTQHQDAGEAMQEVQDGRREYGEMEEAQQEGRVGQQREDLKPSTANPEGGMPPNPDGKESSGGANPQGSGPQQPADSDASAATPAASTVTRAATEGDDRFLRLAAEFENYKKAVARRESEVRERAQRQVLEDLLPIVDNFERAVQASQKMQGEVGMRNLQMGVQGILMQMESALRSHGVEPMSVRGQHFDPLRHEALEAVTGSGQPEGTVLDEAERGYTFKGAVLRPARVRVAS